jgi:hypothetical protein
MGTKPITVYITDVVDGWVAWDGYTWDEKSGAILDKDRDIAIERFKAGLMQRLERADLTGLEFEIVED